MQSPLALVRVYLFQLWIHLSVIRRTDEQQPTPRPHTLNRTYLASFVAFLFAATHGLFGLHLESGLPLTTASLRHSPYIFWRQFFHRQIWPQMDIVMTVIVFFQAFLLFDFALKQVAWLHRFTINRDDSVVLLGGKAVSPYESASLLSLFHRLKFTYNFFGSLIYTLGMLYCYLMVFFVTKVHFVSFWTLAFWSVEFPGIVCVFVLFTVVNLTHIIVSGSCIQIRQEYICQQFGRLLTRLTRTPRLESPTMAHMALNRSVLSICQQLQSFNAFYTNYLTLVFALYNLMQVIFAHVIFFGPTAEASMIILKGVLSVALLETVVLLFALIKFCALVVKKNGRIRGLNRRFAIHCLRHQAVYRLPTQKLLKVETLQWPYLLQFYAFKLLGESRITSKTFYVMTINITGFFLFVTKNMQ